MSETVDDPERLSGIIETRIREAWRGEFRLRAAWSGLVLVRFVRAADLLAWNPDHRCLPAPACDTYWERDLALEVARWDTRCRIAEIASDARSSGQACRSDLRAWRAGFDLLRRP